MDMEHTVMAPAWFIYTLGFLFLTGGLFYLFRLLNPTAVKQVYGYHDKENEIGHGLCMLAMANMLGPDSFSLPDTFWTVTLCLGGLWFLARALTWGRKLSYNKAWWDWAHVGMLLGMALMFHPLALGAWFVCLQAAFWLWFAGYYAYSTFHDLKQPKAFYLGSDIFHFLMGAVMLVMTLSPHTLMIM